MTDRRHLQIELDLNNLSAEEIESFLTQLAMDGDAIKVASLGPFLHEGVGPETTATARVIDPAEKEEIQAYANHAPTDKLNLASARDQLRRVRIEADELDAQNYLLNAQKDVLELSLAKVEKAVITVTVKYQDAFRRLEWCSEMHDDD